MDYQFIQGVKSNNPSHFTLQKLDSSVGAVGHPWPVHDFKFEFKVKSEANPTASQVSYVSVGR